MKVPYNSKNIQLPFKKLLVKVVMTALFMTPFVSYAQPNEVVDIDSNPSDLNMSSFGSLVDLNQSFTPTQSGKMTKLTVTPRAISIGTKTLEIYDGEGKGGSLLHSQTVSVINTNPLEITLTTPIALTGGSKYTFAFDNMDIAIASNFYGGGRYEASTFNTFDSDFLVHLDIGTNIAIANRGDFTNINPMIFDVTTYGTVVGLEASDFDVTNGTASNLFEESPGSWSLDITPTGEGLITVSIASGVATIDGLDNDAASTSTTYDVTPPTNQDVIFTADKLATAGGQVIYNNAAVTTNVFFAPVGTTDFTTGTSVTQGSIFMDCVPQPDICTPQPDVCTPQPDICTPQPDICVPQPDICTPQPDICTPDPISGVPICVPQPDICTPQPDICTPQPDICTPQPDICTPQPDICTPQPDICTNIPIINAPSTIGTYKLFVTDEAGNASSESIATLYVTSETHATSSQIFMDDNEFLSGETANVTFLFLGAVADFTKEDVNVPSGSISDVSSSDGNITFTSTFTPDVDTDQGGLVMSLDRGEITNGSTPGTGLTGSETYDVRTLSPAITSITRQAPAGAITDADEVIFRVTFNVAIDAASFGVSDFTLSGTAAADGTIGAGVIVDSKTYDYTVTGLANSNGTIGLDYTGGLYYIDAGNTISGGDPTGEELFTLVNIIPTFESTAITTVDQDEEYNYEIELSSNLNGVGLNVSATNLPSWLTLSQIDTIRTIAGTGSNGTGGAGGPATSADLSPFLRDVEFDHQGNLYIIQRNKHTIRKVDKNGDISVFAGTGSSGFSGDGGQATAATFNFPSSIAFDEAGNAYIADDFNHRIRKIATDGTITTIAGIGSSGFSGDGASATSAQLTQPRGVTIGPDGNLYITEEIRIRKVDLSNDIITTVAGNGTGAFTSGVAATSSGFFINAIDIDAYGNIYVASQEHAIRKIDGSSGLTSTIAGTGTMGFSGDDGMATSAELNNPNAITVDQEGNIFIGGRGNDRIRKITKGGIISTIAGNGGLGYSGDGGDATQAMILNPEGLAIGPNGEVVFSDAGNLRVRSIQTNRAVLSGTPAQADVGTNSISLTVSNGVESVIQNFTITVSNVNDEPVINGSSFSATQDVAFDETATVTDVDGDFVSLEVTNLPAWLQANNMLNTFTFTTEQGNFTDIIWDGENYLMTNATLHSIQSVDELGQNLTTLAGAGAPTSGTDDGIGMAARFNNPFALDVDSNGKVYVVDNQNHSLREMVKDGNGDYVVSTNPISLASPLDVLVAPNDDIYISDTGSGTIKKISGGVASTLQDAGATDITFTTPYGLAIDDNGVLYVADNGNHAIYKIEGTEKTLIAGTEGTFGLTDGDQITAQFDEPTGIWVNGEGTILMVSDNGNDAIRRIDIDGANATVSTLDDAQSTPLGILLDPNSGSFLIANFDFAHILQAFAGLEISGTPSSLDVGLNEFEITANDGTSIFNQTITVFVSNANDAPEFTSDPTNAGDAVEKSEFNYTLEATDIDGDAISYSATTLPNWLTLEEQEHIVSTIAGNGIDTYSGDAGAATEAGIGTPEALAVDYQGNIYIGQDNYIRKVDTNNIITTIAGDGTAAYSGDGNLAINAQIMGIKDLHCGPDGTLYISTSGGISPNTYDALRKISIDGTITTIAGIYDANFMSTGDGGSAINASFAGASGIFVNNDEEIFIADQNDGIIRKIGTDGVINTVATSVFGAFDIVEDSNGLLYFVNDSELKSIDENDVKTDLLNGLFQFTAQRIAIDNQGNIYGTTNFTPNTIVNVYNIGTGQAKVFANTSETADFSGDGGVASLASFDMIEAVATGVNGDIFVVDGNNNRIRKFTAQQPILTGTPTQSEIGDHSIELEVSDGLLTDQQSFTLTVNTLPEIVNVTGTDGLYGIGDEVVINVQFDSDIVMSGTGTPTLALETGTTDQVASLTGSTSDVLTFTYIVIEGDESDDLAFSSTSLVLNGNTLQSAEGVDAILTFPENGGSGSLDFNNDIIIDGIKPTLSEVFTSSNANNQRAKVGDEVTLTVTAFETLNAAPVVTISGNSVTPTLTNTNEYQAVYTMTENDDEGLIVFTVDFTDIAGNAGNQLNGSDFQIEFDKTIPTLTSVSLSSSNTNNTLAKEGDIISLDIESSENLIDGKAVNMTVLVNGNEVSLSSLGSNQFTSDYTVTLEDADGEIDFQIDFSDLTGNQGVQVTSTTDGSSVTVDQTAPTVEITSTDDFHNVPFEVTFTFSEEVNDFTVDDIVFSIDEGATIEGAISGFSGSGPIYTTTITPPSEGAFEVAVAANVTTDNAGNTNTAAPLFIIEYDTTNPTATITTAITNPTNTTFDIVIDVSEGTAAGFTIDDIDVSNGTAGNFGGDEDDGFTATITPATDGEVTVVVAASAFTDRAGNENDASNTLSVFYDATNPTLMLSTTSADPTNTTFDLVITADETINDLELTDFNVVNGTIGNLSGSGGNNFTATITPTVDGTVSVEIAADAVIDYAGNGNTVSNNLSLEYDATNPTVEIITTSTDPTNTAFDVNINFSEEVSGFTASDITLTNATTFDFFGSGSEYVVSINPAGDGEVTVAIASGIVLDVAGNENDASNTLSIDYDATKPTVELSTGSANPTNTVFDVNITFSEDVTDFVMDDLTITNGTASNFSGSGTSYSAMVTPTSDGTVSVDVAADVASDHAGNGNIAVSTLSLEYDATNPTVEITTTSTDPTNATFDVSITFSEDVTDFIIDDLTITNGTVSNFAGSGSSYSATITPTTDGAVLVDVAADVASDHAGNGNIAAMTLSREFDVTGPTVEITTTSTDPTNAAFDVSITFSEDVTDFIIDDLTITNGTASNFAGGGSSYAATITPTADGSVAIDVAADVASDHAGNGNTAVSTLSLEYDATNPTVEITTTSTDPTNVAFDIGITFSEGVTGFNVDDLTITNGTASNFAGSGSSYAATITPIADGTVSVDVAVDVASDDAGNGNTAASTLSREFDATNPTLTVASITSNNSTSTSMANAGDVVTLNFESSESLQDLPIVTIAGQIIMVQNSSGNAYSAEYTTSESDVVGSIPFTIDFTDAVGNEGTQVTSTTDGSNVEFALVTGINDAFVAQLKVYPNPAQDWVYLELENIESIEQINLYSFTGHIVYTQEVIRNRIEISVNDLPTGIYILSIGDEEGKSIQRKISIQ